MNIEEIKQFKTIDGSLFNYLDEAKKYNELLRACDEIENVIISIPKDDMDLRNHPMKYRKNRRYYFD